MLNPTEELIALLTPTNVLNVVFPVTVPPARGNLVANAVVSVDA